MDGKILESDLKIGHISRPDVTHTLGRSPAKNGRNWTSCYQIIQFLSNVSFNFMLMTLIGACDLPSLIGVCHLPAIVSSRGLSSERLHWLGSLYTQVVRRLWGLEHIFCTRQISFTYWSKYVTFPHSHSICLFSLRAVANDNVCCKIGPADSETVNQSLIY